MSLGEFGWYRDTHRPNIKGVCIMPGEYKEKNIIIRDQDNNGNLRSRLVSEAEFWLMGGENYNKGSHSSRDRKICFGSSY